MKQLSAILYLVACGLDSLLGTGLKACSFDFRTPRVLILLEKGFTILPSETPNLAFFRGLQQKGKAIVLQGVVQFDNSTPDDEIGKRASTGKEYLTLKNPYKWKYTFDNGLYFYKACTALESNDRYDLIMLDDKGDMLLSSTVDGKGKGLDLGMLNSGAYMIGNDNMNAISVQIDRLDFDKKVSWITANNLDFGPSDLDGINDIILFAAPVNSTATSIVVTTTLSDRSHFVDGLTLANFRVKKTIAGVTTVITPSAIASDASAKTYTFTVPASAIGTVYTVETFDSTLTVNTILTPLGILYKGNVATVTVA